MANLDLNKILSGIEKTGFKLEHRLARLFSKTGWTVIPNKYYVDDQTRATREIDLVAYRAKDVGPFNLYTVLLISSKKSDDEVWTLLSRELDLRDLNTDFTPAHIWTNEPATGHLLRSTSWRSEYYERASAAHVGSALTKPSVDIFAFQEVSRGGAPRNDKAFFATITSLMKAQAYELAALPNRKKDPALYQFNLLAILEPEIVRVQFDDEANATAISLDEDVYVARYIISEKETFARIHFMTYSAAERAAESYIRLHKFNCSHFVGLYNSFYENAVERSDRLKLFEQAFAKKVRWRLSARIAHFSGSYPDVLKFDLWWEKQSMTLRVGVSASDEALAFLNRDEDARATVGAALQTIYRYDGPFEFVSDVPF
jgi:hypothetical protein